MKIQSEITYLKPQLITAITKVNSSLDTRVQLYQKCTQLDPKIKLLMQQKEILKKDFLAGKNGLTKIDQS